MYIYIRVCACVYSHLSPVRDNDTSVFKLHVRQARVHSPFRLTSCGQIKRDGKRRRIPVTTVAVVVEEEEERPFHLNSRLLAMSHESAYYCICENVCNMYMTSSLSTKCGCVKFWISKYADVETIYIYIYKRVSSVGC